jgi:hypothetical protein
MHALNQHMSRVQKLQVASSKAGKAEDMHTSISLAALSGLAESA